MTTSECKNFTKIETSRQEADSKNKPAWLIYDSYIRTDYESFFLKISKRQRAESQSWLWELAVSRWSEHEISDVHALLCSNQDWL